MVIRPGEPGPPPIVVPPTVYVVAAIVSAQVGAAVAKYLFAALGPAATVSLRTAFAALVLLLVWRPHLRGRSRADLLAALALGVTLAGLSLSFYAALERIPLGVAMTLEFAGPLGIALVGSRRRLDLLWGVLAVAGILVLSPIGGTVDPLGAALALLGGAFWAASILLSARIGRTIPGGGGAGAGDGGGRDRHAPVRHRRRRTGGRGSRGCFLPRSGWGCSPRSSPFRWNWRRCAASRSRCSGC